MGKLMARDLFLPRSYKKFKGDLTKVNVDKKMRVYNQQQIKIKTFFKERSVFSKIKFIKHETKDCASISQSLIQI